MIHEILLWSIRGSWSISYTGEICMVRYLWSWDMRDKQGFVHSSLFHASNIKLHQIHGNELDIYTWLRLRVIINVFARYFNGNSRSFSGYFFLFDVKNVSRILIETRNIFWLYLFIWCQNVSTFQWSII